MTPRSSITSKAAPRQSVPLPPTRKRSIREIQNATDRITELVAQQKSLPDASPAGSGTAEPEARQAINRTKAPDQCPQAGCLPDRERLGEPYSSTLCQGR